MLFNYKRIFEKLNSNFIIFLATINKKINEEKKNY